MRKTQSKSITRDAKSKKRANTIALFLLLVDKALLHRFTLQSSERLLIHVPFLQDRKDRLRPESSAHELPEDASGLLLIRGLFQALAAQVLARLLLFVHLVIDRGHGLLNHLAMDSLDLQVGDHAPAAKFLVVAAKGRIRGSVLGVVEVALILETADDEFHKSLAIFGIGLHAPPQKALEFGHRAHAASQGAHGILVEFVLGAGLFGTGKGHSAINLTVVGGFGGNDF